MCYLHLHLHLHLHFEFQASGDNKFESNQENKCDHFSTTSLDE